MSDEQQDRHRGLSDDRPELQVNIHDLDAVGDVVDWLAEHSDQMDVRTAIEMATALEALGKKLTVARSLCQTQAKRLLDGQPTRIGDTMYVEKATGKWRPNQGKIRGRVAARACVDDDGVVIELPLEAARQAIDFMYDLFVAPSEMPKQAGLTKLGLSTEDVAEWRKTGSELKAVNL